MLELARYLVLQGYGADEITILTTYTGQMFLLREVSKVLFKLVLCFSYQWEILILGIINPEKQCCQVYGFGHKHMAFW